RETQRWTGVERQRRARNFFHGAQTSAMSGFEFAIDVFRIAVGRLPQIAVEAREIAIDNFVVNDAFDCVDGGGMTFGGELRAAFAMQAFEFVEAIIERIDEVRGGAA